MNEIKIKRIFYIFISLLLTFLIIFLSFSSFSSFFKIQNIQKNLNIPKNNLRESIKRRLQQWGTVFDGGIIPGKFPERKCTFAGKPICCSALNNPSKKVIKHNSNSINHGHCTTEKKYFPSPYETRHLEISKEWSKIEDFETRRKKIIEFIESPEEVKSSNIWLERVSIRQSAGNIIEENEEDREYLSKFKVIRKCQGEIEHSWWEYIEPLTVHGRHPHSLQCWRARDKVSQSKTLPSVSVLSVDYILLQSHKDIIGNYQHHHNNNNRTQKVLPRDLIPNAFMFDAGTSRFDSSLYWFVCAYEQLGFIFDSLFGWEYTLLEPKSFWDHVPQRYVSIYHFFNVPITEGMTKKHSPLRIIKQTVLKDDFVSFKLDVDTPSIEIPIALELLSNNELHGLIDEFFFELHFRCEIMMYCGWEDKMPEELLGLKLNREHVLEYFQNLRKVGIRSHFWP